MHHSSFLPQVTELPDTLCIHLKRFRHDFAFSSKISTRVQFEEVTVNLALDELKNPYLKVLDMSPWLHNECTSKEKTYRLSGIVSFIGSLVG